MHNTEADIWGSHEGKSAYIILKIVSSFNCDNMLMTWFYFSVCSYFPESKTSMLITKLVH